MYLCKGLMQLLLYLAFSLLGGTGQEPAFQSWHDSVCSSEIGWQVYAEQSSGTLYPGSTNPASYSSVSDLGWEKQEFNNPLGTYKAQSHCALSRTEKLRQFLFPNHRFT